MTMRFLGWILAAIVALGGPAIELDYEPPHNERPPHKARALGWAA